MLRSAYNACFLRYLEGRATPDTEDSYHWIAEVEVPEGFRLHPVRATPKTVKEEKEVQIEDPEQFGSHRIAEDGTMILEGSFPDQALKAEFQDFLLRFRSLMLRERVDFWRRNLAPLCKADPAGWLNTNYASVTVLSQLRKRRVTT